MNYNSLTRQYFERAPQVGVLEGSGTYRGAAGSRALGTWVQFDLAVQQEEACAVVREARFLAYGCPYVIAAAAWIAKKAPGVQAGGALPASVLALQQRFEAPVEKLGRLLAVEDAWNDAMKMWRGSMRSRP